VNSDSFWDLITLVKKRFANRFFIIGLLLVVFSCAQQRVPAGGKEDKKPPYAVSFSPDSVVLNQASFPRISVFFNEEMKKSTTRKALSVAPYFFKVKTEWQSYTQLDIYSEAADTLTETIVVTLKRELTDLRNNGLANDIVIFVSPADSLPTNAISGSLQGEHNIKAAKVWLVAIDSLPSLQPLRITTIATDKRFRFGNLATSQGVIPILINDLAPENSWQPYDRIAIPFLQQDITDFRFWRFQNNAGAFTDIDFEEVLLARRDHVRLRMSGKVLSSRFEVVQNDSVPAPKWVYTTAQKPDVVDIWWADSIAAEEVLFRYIVNDTTANTKMVFLDDERDQSPQKIKLTSASAGLVPKDTLTFNFSLPVDTSALRVTLNPSLPAFKVLWDSPVEFKLLAPGGLALKQEYALQISAAPADTIYAFSFNTATRRDLGSATGKIRKPDKWQTNKVRIIARHLESNNQYLAESTNTTFNFPYLKEGFYAFHAWLDENDNDVYDTGSVDPLNSPEPFWFAADTLKIRKRWENRSLIVIF
jgi:hypothetical protein